jgi:hypothetical protein
MNNKLPILIAATIGLSILTTSISVNSALARSTKVGMEEWDMEEWDMEGMEEWATGEQGQ